MFRSTSCVRAIENSRFFSVAIAVTFVLLSPAAARAVPVLAEATGCIGLTCFVEPIGGPVDVDPTGFTLEVSWGPEHIELIGNPPGGHWDVDLNFEFTGVHSGLENFGLLTLLDHAGNPLALNENFDDLNPIGVSTFPANYEIFVDNPGDLGNSFFIRGFTLALSDGSGVDTLRFVSADFFPAAIGTVPEPTTLLMFGLGALTATNVDRLRQLLSVKATARPEAGQKL